MQSQCRKSVQVIWVFDYFYAAVTITTLLITGTKFLTYLGLLD